MKFNDNEVVEGKHKGRAKDVVDDDKCGQ